MSLKNHMTTALPERVDMERHYVAADDSAPMSVRHWLVAWGGLMLLAVTLWASIYGILLNLGLAASWSWPLAMGMSLVAVVKLGRAVLLALTGKSVAMREVESNERVTMHKTNEEAGVWNNRLANEAEAERNRHAEEMARISAQMREEMRALAGDVADLRRGLVQQVSQIQRLQAPPDMMGAWAAAPAALSVDEEQALTWACSLYGEDGKPDPGKVVPGKGHIQVKVPWNSVEGWEPGATSLLVDGPNGFQPVLVKAGSSHNYKLNVAGYPTVQEIQNALGKVTVDGWVGSGRGG